MRQGYHPAPPHGKTQLQLKFHTGLKGTAAQGPTLFWLLENRPVSLQNYRIEPQPRTLFTKAPLDPSCRFLRFKDLFDQL